MKVTEIIVELKAPGAAAIKTNSLAGGAPTSGLRNLAANNVKFRRFFVNIERKRKSLGTASERWSAKMTTTLGPWMTLLKLLGVAAACYELWDDLGIAEEMYTSGEIGEDELRDFRQFYTGVFVAQMLLPAVARAIANSRYVVWIAKFITRVIGLGTGVVTAGASIVALVATEAFFSWFTWWLGTEKAKDWLSNELLMPLILLGKIPEAAWSSLTGYYEKVDKKRTDTGKDSGKSNANTTAMGSVKPRVEPTLINGVRVTDSDGYLLPNADLNPAVQAALMQPNSPEAKKFAAIPKPPSGGAADTELGYANRVNPTKVVDPATGKLVPAA